MQNLQNKLYFFLEKKYDFVHNQCAVKVPKRADIKHSNTAIISSLSALAVNNSDGQMKN